MTKFFKIQNIFPTIINAMNENANQQEVVQSGPIIQEGTQEDTFAVEVIW